MPAGRPSVYTQEIADTICLRISEGESLRSICRGDDMPAKSTVLLWAANDKDFSDQYTRAMLCRADHHFDEVLEIADDEDLKPDDKRVRVDARKWVLGRMNPKKYGDRSTVDMNHNYRNLSTEELEARLAKLEAGNS